MVLAVLSVSSRNVADFGATLTGTVTAPTLIVTEAVSLASALLVTVIFTFAASRAVAGYLVPEALRTPAVDRDSQLVSPPLTRSMVHSSSLPESPVRTSVAVFAILARSMFARSAPT